MPKWVRRWPQDQNQVLTDLRQKCSPVMGCMVFEVFEAWLSWLQMELRSEMGTFSHRTSTKDLESPQWHQLVCRDWCTSRAEPLEHVDHSAWVSNGSVALRLARLECSMYLWMEKWAFVHCVFVYPHTQNSSANCEHATATRSRSSTTTLRLNEWCQHKACDSC